MKKIIPVILAILIIFLGYNLYSCKLKSVVNKITVNEQTDFYSIKAEYPQDKMDKDEVMKQLVGYLVNQKKEEWKIGGEVYNTEQKIAKDFPDRPKMKYELNISYFATTSKKFSSNSYVFSVYEFTGGAHGNIALATYNFTKNGQVKIEDMLNFDQDKYVSLARILRSKLITILGANSSENMINEGLGFQYMKPDGSFDKSKCKCDGYFFPSNVQNFTISDNGLRFIFSQYQVAPYVVGTPEVLLTWDELRDLLLSNNPLKV